MQKFSRILAPVAFSARCEGAVQYAGALACHFQSELTLLHVVMPLQSYGFPDALAVAPEVMDNALAAGKEQLDAFLAQELKGIRVKREVIEGEPAQTVIDYANDGKFDLIVMPTHGYGPFRRFLLGSVTAKVLHDAQCPVWTGPHLENAPAYPQIRFGKVLCAIDLGPNSRPVLEWAANFAREYGSELTVTHAIPGSTVSLGGITFDPAWSGELKNQANDSIAYLMGEIGIRGEISIQAGDAPAMVRAVADEMSADLVVIGRGGHPGLMGRLRANAYAILREAPCPVAAI